MIKILHTGDIHANKSRAEQVVKLLDFYIDEVKSKKIDIVLICGDFWDCAVVNNSAFAKIISKMAVLINLVPVYMIYGTASHEINSSLEIFAQMGANVTYKPHLWTFEKGDEKIDILGVPEPRRSDFIAKTTEETNKKINAYLKDAFNIKHDNPLIVMHHNEISGATLQNGQFSKSETKLTMDMYMQCKPIYIAAAHIHQPQSIGGFIKYCGSPIPCNFGELHKPRYELLTFDNGFLKSEPVYTPFPTNRVIECDSNLFRKLFALNFTDTRVKVKLSLTAEERKLFKIKDEAAKLKEKTNAKEILINVVTQKEVSVRSKEIVSATSIIDKLKIYANVNEINLSDDVIQKAKDIEESLLIKYTYPTHSFELMSLSLRGAKGLTGREEINIDFSKYEQGVMALIGQNGSGKTTILENCSAYPCLLTRSGTLRSHFYLKDSHRIVVYRDENNRYYRFTIQLAAHIDTGLVKYFAETSDDEGTTWQSVKDVDGNLDTYKTYVENLMGSLSMYLRTAFFTKGKVKGISDIATATKSERIQLLSELLGTEQLTSMHDLIKEKLKSISNELDNYSNIEETFNNCIDEVEKKRGVERNLNADLIKLENQIEFINSDLVETRKKAEDFNKNYGKFESAIQLKTDCENKYSDLAIHYEKLLNHKAQNDFYKLHEKAILEYKDTLNSSQSSFDKLNELSKNYQIALKEKMQSESECNNLKIKLENEQHKLDNTDYKIAEAEKNVLSVVDTCPTCGAKLSEKKKRDLLKANEYVYGEINALKEFKTNQKEIVSSLKKSVKKAEQNKTTVSEKEKSLHIEYEELDLQTKAIKVYLEQNKQYKDYIDYVLVDNLEKDIEITKKSLDTAKEMLNSLSDIKFIDYQSQIEKLENRKTELQNEVIQSSMKLASIQTQIKQLEETKETLQSQETKAKELSKDFADYSILDKAFSNSGIQALELEAAAPDIATLTNTILLESYGDKFSVSFTTLRQGKSKIIDDCSIDVTNNESGWTTPIELLSEGEKVWIMQALYYAMSIIRMQRTGFTFMVRFADESDGSLDSEMRLKYFNMITSAHKAGNSRLTVLVTHSQEIKDIVTQSIQL